MSSSRKAEENQPLYVRWTPLNCPYALELRLDLITRLGKELAHSESSGLEVGGVFFGVLPTQSSPTLRLDDLIVVPGKADSREFSLEPAQLTHLAQISAESRSTTRPFVGFFRGNLRSGAPSPTAADLEMLSPQFPSGLYAFLILSQECAFFFLAVGGQLSQSPSCPPFALEESAMQQLPELPAEATEDVRNFNFAKTAPRRPMPWPAILSFALVLFLIATWTMGSRISAMFRPDSNQIDLSVLKSGKNLKITWDHSSPIISKAQGATLVIMDGSIHREVKLDVDDLKLGQISYERISKKVYVVMSLDTPGIRLPAQTFDWAGD